MGFIGDWMASRTAVAPTDSDRFLLRDAEDPTTMKVSTYALLKADLSAQYLPMSGDRRWLPAFAMYGYGAAATVDSTYIGVLLDATVAEGLVSSDILPAAWLTAKIYVYWYNAGAGAGNVMWTLYKQTLADTETIASFPGGEQTTVAATTQNVLKVTKITASAIAVTDPLLSFLIFRQADNVADTLANDIGIMGLEFRRAS